MSDAPLTDIGACVFDAYGTLLDVHSAVTRHRDLVGPRYPELSSEWRRRQLEYSWLRSLMQAHTDFETVTEQALRVSLESLGLDDALVPDLMGAYRQLDAFPEVAQTLEVLARAGLQRAILSNGTPEMLADGVQYAGIEQQLDAVFSVETVGVFKPDPRVYQLCVDKLQVPAEQIVFMSSNAWDAAGAAHFGFRVVWVNRYQQAQEALPGRPTFTIPSLDALPGLLGIC